MTTIGLAILLLMHPVHVSLTGIEYDSGTRVWSVFVKVWTDDLEDDMKLGLNDGSAITGDSTEQFFRYLTDRVILLEDGKMLPMELLTAVEDGLEHRFSLRAQGGEGATTVTVINRIMIRLYDDQANMMLFSLNDIEDGYRFTVTDTIKSYQF